MYTLKQNLPFDNQEKGVQIDKDYLFYSYKKSGNSLYSHTVFNFIADQIKNIQEPICILDLGCADGRSQALLNNYGIHISRYFGVDSNSRFSPSFVSDIRDVDEYISKIGFVPNVVLITDVLEHLDDGAEDIRKLLKRLKVSLPSCCQIFISAPQMYRLDRFKFQHLCYPEHKVRFNLWEWKSLLSECFDITSSHGIGYISTLPYFVMFAPWYKEDKSLGKFFKLFRDLLSRSRTVRKVDYALTKLFGGISILQSFSNSALFVCRFTKSGVPKERV